MSGSERWKITKEMKSEGKSNRKRRSVQRGFGKRSTGCRQVAGVHIIHIARTNHGKLYETRSMLELLRDLYQFYYIATYLSQIL